MPRKPEREAMEALRLAVETFPHLRICQLIENAVGSHNKFYTTDEQLGIALRKYIDDALIIQRYTDLRR